MSASPLRSIPAVDKVLQALEPVRLPRPAVVALVRRELAALRRARSIPPFEDVVARVGQALRRRVLSRLQPVINGTGVVIHTNLGRAPLGSSVVDALADLALHYNNLEFDLADGHRGGRASYLEEHLALLCRGEAATVVNNCAAALILILRHFTASKPEVIISRGELVQIGGGFRIPDILETAGAQLKEVGTTNKTTLDDYGRAVSPRTGLILKVHRSNFFMSGFVASPPTEEIAALARRKKIPLVEDLGSGAVVATDRLAARLSHEPMPGEVLKKGVDLVCFSGDKLMGGPQAGIIAGRARRVAGLKKDPFFRALRCDKLILGALQATVDLYLSRADTPGDLAVPVAEMISLQPDALAARAEALLRELKDLPAVCRAVETLAQIGGGTLPQAELPSVALDIKPAQMAASELGARLRRGDPPVVGYISGGRFRVDLRTVFPRQDADLARCLRRALSPAPFPEPPSESP